MIKLVPITEDSFRKFLESETKNYAEEKVKSGNWRPEEAYALSKEQMNSLLPHGKETEGQYVMAITDENGSEVGVLWYGITDRGDLPGAYIWDIVVYEEFRGKGYGKEAMKALEGEVLEKGVHRISLQVFGHNTVARSLYEKAGYEITNIVMSKVL